MVWTQTPLAGGSKMATRRKNITKDVVKDAVPEASRYMIWDTGLKSFGLRVMPSGAKSYIVRFRVGSHRGAKGRSITLGSTSTITPDKARKMAREYLASGHAGIDLEEQKREETTVGMTVSDAIDLWVKEAAPINRRSGAKRKPVNVKLDVDRLNIHIRPIIGAMPLKSVTKADIENLRDAITAGRTRTKKKTKARGMRNATGGAGTAARALRTLSSVFAHAEDHQLVVVNPCRGVKLQPSRKCERYLTTSEARRLGEVLDAWDYQEKSVMAVGVIRLLTLTGARSGEVTGLKWSEIDFDQGFLRLDASKTGKSVRPLSGVALKFLSSWPRRHKVWVFPAQTGDSHFQGVQKDWRAIRKEAGLEDVRIHDLRHSFASFGISAGLSLPIIGALLGHKDVSTTQRYAHLANDSARKAADGVADLVANALGMN